MSRQRLPLLVLIVLSMGVLAHHLYQAEAHDLSRWKGGGMGMFTTADTPGSRLVEISLDTTQGRFLADPGSLQGAVELYRSTPTFAHLRDLCEVLMARDWYANGRFDLRWNGDEAVAIAETEPLRSDASKSLEITAITLEGWRLVLDAQTGLMHHAAINRLDVEAAHGCL